MTMLGKRSAVVLVASIIIVSTFFVPRVHAYFYSPATAAKILDPNSSTHVLGTWGTSTKLAYIGPAPSTATDPVFYTGIIAHALDTCTDCEGVKTLHITMSGLKPDGTALSGLEMAPSPSPILGPTSNTNAYQDLLNYVAQFILANLPYGLGTGIQNAVSYGQTTPAPYGSSSTTSWADWTCNPCNNSIGQFDFADGSLQEAFTLHVDPNLQGTYFLQITYHVDMSYCSVIGSTYCNLISEVTQDYIDNLLYCYVKCTSSSSTFVSQAPNSGTQTAQSLKPSQTTYLDSQLSTSTFNTADPIYVGTYQKTQEALIGFSLPSISANSVIMSANIQVFQSQVNPDPPPFGNLLCKGSGSQCQISVSQISASWDASKATWNNPPTTTGAQTVLRYPQTGQWTIDVTSQVQAGYASGNFYGIELSPADPTEIFQYGIQSGLSQSQAPVLRVNYITYQSPPSSMCTGQTASVAITMQNFKLDSNGNVLSLSNWVPSSVNPTNPFVLESENPEGNSNWGMSSVALNQAVLYPQSYTFSFTVTAPMVPGTYNFQWRMAQQGVGSFGDYTPNLVVNIKVCGDFSISASPTSMTIPQTQFGTSTITLASVSPFSGTVSLSASTNAIVNGVTYLYWDWSTCNTTDCQTSATLTSGGTATPSINIFAYSDTPTGTWTVTVKGTDSSGTLVHTATIAITVTAFTSGGGGGGSLAHGTLITMADGGKVPVENINVGDKLLGYNPTTSQYTISTVNSIKIVDATTMLVINTGTGTPLRVDASPTEVLWTKLPDGTAQWLPVTQLKVGEDLWTPSGWVPVTSIASIAGGHHVMYDLTATDPYFANGYLDPPHPS